MYSYIDAHKLLVNLAGKSRNIRSVEDVPDVLVKCLADASTPDVRPERYGSWVYGENDVPHCSECGAEVKEISPFCPQCGAKMDGGEESG